MLNFIGWQNSSCVILAFQRGTSLPEHLKNLHFLSYYEWGVVPFLRSIMVHPRSIANSHQQNLRKGGTDNKHYLPKYVKNKPKLPMSPPDWDNNGNFLGWGSLP